MTVVGEAGDGVEAVALAGCRIARESLTNVVRHSTARGIDITVRYGADAVHLEIRDDGDGSDDSRTAGRGTRDMARRATEVGGTVTMGPLEDGGFGVRAKLPR